MASYIYSKLDGNFDGEYAPFTNVGADPNISRRLRLLRLLHQRQRPHEDHEQAARCRTTAGISSRSPGVYFTPFKLSIGALRLLAQRHAAHALRLLGRLRPLRVLPRPTAAPKAGRRATTTPTSTSAIRSPSGRRELNLLLDVFNLLEHPTRRPASTSAGASRSPTTPPPPPSTRTTNRPSSAPPPDPCASASAGRSNFPVWRGLSSPRPFRVWDPKLLGSRCEPLGSQRGSLGSQCEFVGLAVRVRGTRGASS